MSPYGSAGLPREVQLSTPRGHIMGARTGCGEQFYSQNCVFYIAGLLNPMLEEMETQSYLTAKTKFIQYRQDIPQGIFEYEWWKTEKNMECYDTGLAVLQRINPRLAYVSTEDMKAAITHPPMRKSSGCYHHIKNLVYDLLSNLSK